MNVNELCRMNYRLDQNKYDLLEKGAVFDFAAILPDGTELHTGIGSGEMMCRLVLLRASDLFRATEGKVSVERFAESMKQNLILWLEAHPVTFGEISVLPAE